MKVADIKAVLSEEAKEQGFFGQFIGKLDHNNEWDDFNALCEIYGVKTSDDLIEYLQAYDYFRNQELTAPFTVATLFNWRAEGKSFNQYCLPFSQVSEQIYQYFLEVLPPMYKNRGFMVSEPYDYDPTVNQSTYATFCKVDGKCYFLGDIAPKKYDEVFNELFNTL